jgi:hypothetical protein
MREVEVKLELLLVTLDLSSSSWQMEAAKSEASESPNGPSSMRGEEISEDTAS